MIPRIHRVSSAVFRGKQITEKSFSVGTLSVRVLRSEPDALPKVSVIVSKKVARSAVARNTMRRRVYSVFETLLAKMPNGVIIFVYPKKETASESFVHLKKSSGHIVEMLQ